jgi:integrase
MSDIWNLYQEQHLPSITRQSQIDTIKRAKNIIPELLKFRMVDIDAVTIDNAILDCVAIAKSKTNVRRFSFDREIQTLRAILNWYRENYDVMFTVPILKRHFISGTLKKKSNRKAPKMSKDQVKCFFDSLEDEFWKDFACIHFFMAGRVQEPAGLQLENIDFRNRVLRISDVSVWGHDKKFMYLKEVPKNGEDRLVSLNNTMINVLRRRVSDDRSEPCEFFRESDSKRLNFVFHLKGQPLTYRQIQHHYNKALKKAELWPEFSATHILRKAMANIVRQSLGLEAAQAVGGWKSRSIVEKIYTDDAPDELNRSAVEYVGELFEKK